MLFVILANFTNYLMPKKGHAPGTIEVGSSSDYGTYDSSPVRLNCQFLLALESVPRPR